MTAPHTASGIPDGTSFEDALVQLQQIVATLETGELTLDRTIDDFQRGSALAAYCQRLIADAQLRITELAPSADTPTAGS